MNTTYSIAEPAEINYTRQEGKTFLEMTEEELLAYNRAATKRAIMINSPRGTRKNLEIE